MAKTKLGELWDQLIYFLAVWPDKPKKEHTAKKSRFPQETALFHSFLYFTSSSAICTALVAAPLRT